MMSLSRCLSNKQQERYKTSGKNKREWVVDVAPSSATTKKQPAVDVGEHIKQTENLPTSTEHVCIKRSMKISLTFRFNAGLSAH